MYTVPAKVPNKAKDLIATFENGEASNQPPGTNGDTVVVVAPNGGDPTSPGGATVRIRVSREVSLDELAQPGTARRLQQEFESRVQHTSSDVLMRSPGAKAYFQLLRSSVADQEPADSSPTGDELQLADERSEPQCNGDSDVFVTERPADIPSPTSAEAAEEEPAKEVVATTGNTCNSIESVLQDELAQPGTARRLLQEFESRVQQAAAANTKVNFRLSKSASADQHRQSEPCEPQCNGSNDIVVQETLVELPASATADEAAGTAAEDLEAKEVMTTTCNSCNTVDDAQGTPAAGVAVLCDTNVDKAHDTALIVVAGGAAALTLDTNPVAEQFNDSLNNTELKTILVVSAVRDKTALYDSLLQLCQTPQRKLLISDVFSETAAVDEERQKVVAADLVVILYQPIFNCVPASMQRWFETVFAAGFSAEQNKKCIVLLTTHPQQEKTGGVLGDVSAYLLPLQIGLLQQVGFAVLQPQVIDNELNQSELIDIINQWSTRLDNIWNECPVVSP